MDIVLSVFIVDLELLAVELFKNQNSLKNPSNDKKNSITTQNTLTLIPNYFTPTYLLNKGGLKTFHTSVTNM